MPICLLAPFLFFSLFFFFLKEKREGGQNQPSGKFCKFTHGKVKGRKWETSLYSECDCVSSTVTGLVKSVIDNSSES